MLRGRQWVAALWLPADWFDARTRAARMLVCWRPGASALRFLQGDLLCYATPLELDCAELPGWPLRLEGRTLCSAPLTAGELAALSPADVWIVQGGDMLALERRAGAVLDPADWLQVRQCSLHDTFDCRIALPPAVMLDPAAREVRAVLDDAVGAASAESEQFLKSLERVVQQPSRSAPLWLRALSALGGLSRWLSQRGPDSASKTTSTNAVLPRRAPTSGSRWREWLARMTLLTQLGSLLGRVHAKHLQRMLEYFEAGNLQEALRHAIPLEGNRLAALGQSFSMPRRRDRLELSQGVGPASGIGIGVELMEHLRQLYRRAFNQLDREQRIDEAVFVLAELLNAKQEALDYLEKHQRFAQAAELALRWDQPADVIVRLHCLAGNWRRAVAVALRDGAFANAILQLEKRWPDAARRLREEWGSALTRQGDWLGAVDAVWPIPALRARAAQWLQIAESSGGQLAARALVQRAVLLPDTLERYADRLRELQRDRTLWRERAALAGALLSLGSVKPPRPLAARIVPALLADHAQGQRCLDQPKLRQLVQLTGDVLLLADLPSQGWPAASREPLTSRASPLHLEAPPAGAHAVLDAVPLSDERYLLALGEAGARIIDATGRKLAQFAVPAQHLVIAYSQQVALALARRESLWRVSRLDLVQQSSVDLGLIELDCHCNQFDGIHWSVAQGRRLRVLDTQHSVREVVWQITDLPGEVLELSTSPTLEQMLLQVPGKPQQLWISRLPQRRLTNRDDLHEPVGKRLLIPAGGCVDASPAHRERGSLSVSWQVAGRSHTSQLAEGTDFWPPVVCGEWLVVGTTDFESRTWLHWLSLATGAECLHIEWPCEQLDAPKTRAYDQQYLIFDAAGRLVHVDAATGMHRACTVR